MKRMTDEMHDIQRVLDNPACAQLLSRHAKIENQRTQLAMLVDAIRHRTTLDITDLMAGAGDSELMESKADDIELAVPPWSSTWVEWGACPETEWFSIARQFCKFTPRRFGVLVIGLSADEFCESMASPQRAVNLFENKEKKRKFTPDERRDIFREEHPLLRFASEEVLYNVAWYLLIYPFVRSGNGIIGPLFETHIILDSEGRVLDIPEDDERINVVGKENPANGAAVSLWNEWSYVSPHLDMQKWTPERLNHAHMAFSQIFFMPALMAFHYANYQNIVTREVTPQYASRQARRDAERRNEPPLCKYHILEIGPPGVKDPRRFRPLAEVVAETPLHGVRRHCRRYGPKYGKGLLFGKYEGMFWIAPHTRGKAEVGEIQKDYREGRKILEVMHG